MRFLSRVLATIVGIFVFLMLFFCLIAFIGAVFSGSDTISIADDSVIVLDLSEVVEDYGGKSHFSDFENSEINHDGLSDIIKAIQIAKTDNNIKGISIINNESILGIAQTKALRDALEDFKTSKKFIYSYANTYSQKEYYLNSVANTMYINPVGSLDFKGLATEVMFYKDFQDKTGLRVEIIRHGKYKSAVEPFLENKMSDANKQQTTDLLASIWSSIVTDIAKSRSLSILKLNEIANGLLARKPQMALDQKLIDIVAYEDIYHNDIKKTLKIKSDQDYNTISILEYAEYVAFNYTNTASDKIAIIYAQGEIQSGEGDVNIIGEKSMNRAIADARNDKNIKAIVLRVNSPGGNALTSDLIWRAIEITKKTKPVVVSMGNYAASGGYYIACNADFIFAENTTITGSIGVFGMLPNFNEAANRYGLHTEQVKTHENASDYSPFVPLSENFKAFSQEGVEEVYTTFVNRVAAGRKMTFEQVDALAQGRVWSGSDALKNKLIDKIGNMNDAIKYAAKLAKTNDYGTVDYPEYEKNYKDLLKNLPFAQSKADIIKEEIGAENYQILQNIKKIKARKGIQAMMPFEININ